MQRQLEINESHLEEKRKAERRKNNAAKQAEGEARELQMVPATRPAPTYKGPTSSPTSNHREEHTDSVYNFSNPLAPDRAQ